MNETSNGTSTNGHSAAPGPLGLATHTDEPLKALFDSTPVNFVYCDVNLVVRHVNEATARTLDRFAEELEFTSATLVGEPFDVVYTFGATERRSLRAGKPVHVEARIGTEAMSLDATPIRGPGGAFHAVGITWEIVTERTAALEAARRTEQMIDGAPINLMYCDKTLKFST